MKVAAVLLILCSLAVQGDAAQSMLAAQTSARIHYWLREYFEGRWEAVAWMQGGDKSMLANVTRVLDAHRIDFLAEGSLAWWAEVLPYEAARARAVLRADPHTRSAVR